jgi:hypothetical protein
VNHSPFTIHRAQRIPAKRDPVTGKASPLQSVGNKKKSKVKRQKSKSGHWPAETTPHNHGHYFRS